MKFEEEYQIFLDQWGFDAQAMMCIEEMSELTKALCKYMRFNKENAPDEVKENIKEEIADVLNTVEQMQLIFGEKEIEKIRQEKIERTKTKIKKLRETKNDKKRN